MAHHKIFLTLWSLPNVKHRIMYWHANISPPLIGSKRKAMGKALGTKWDAIGNVLGTHWEQKDLKLNHHPTLGFKSWCRIELKLVDVNEVAWQKNSFMVANFLKLRFFLVMSLRMKLHIFYKQFISMNSSGLLLCMRLGDPKIDYKGQFFWLELSLISFFSSMNLHIL